MRQASKPKAPKSEGSVLIHRFPSPSPKSGLVLMVPGKEGVSQPPSAHWDYIYHAINTHGCVHRGSICKRILTCKYAFPRKHTHVYL